MATGDVELLRQTLAKLREDYDPDGLDPRFDAAVGLTHRSTAGRPRARAETRRMTARLAEEVRQFADANPEMSYLRIAKHFDINPGRVSEAMTGEI